MSTGESTILCIYFITIYQELRVVDKLWLWLPRMTKRGWAMDSDVEVQVHSRAMQELFS